MNRPRAVLGLMYVVAIKVEPVFRVALRYSVGGGLNDGFQGLPGTGLGCAQPRFELAGGPFSGVKIGRVRWPWDTGLQAGLGYRYGPVLLQAGYAHGLRTLAPAVQAGGGRGLGFSLQRDTVGQLVLG